MHDMTAKESRRSTTLACAIVLVLAPVTIVCGELVGGSYYLTSLLVIIYTMVPFFISFENRRPQARELVVIAVMCAIAVASRAAFIWLPHFKPMVAIIMITGIALGSRAGFLTGALAAFVSNFIFGQGPWTPWQMFAFGIAGFVMGLLAEKGFILRDSLRLKERVLLSMGGGLFVVCVVGPILDTCALFTMVSSVTLEGAVAVYLSGLPVNIVHAVATVLTLFLLTNPILDKLERIRVKYGMME